MKGKTIFFSFFILVLLVISVSTIISFNKKNNINSFNNFDGKVTLYKSENCGCCGLYANYLKGKINLNVINLPNIGIIKKQYNIPSSLESCHTTIIDNYFVEGHIPFEAINKLLTEKPDILGIAMPGMPSGSPGMPGRKFEDFNIYGVNKDGTNYLFMTL